jgi:hypothetical protein
MDLAIVPTSVTAKGREHMPDTGRPPISPGSTFDDVHADERDLLERRRAWVHDQPKRPTGAGTAPVREIGTPGETETSETGRNFRTWNTVGLALSGGGIRSATFSLGVLQALDVHRLTHRFDYLSTVSGGGYMGSALSSTLQESGGKFVFGGDGVIRDTDAVGHLRNFSNYLLPRDHSPIHNAADALAVVGRGLVSNLIIVASAIAFLVALTICAYPGRDHAPGSYLLGLVHPLSDLVRALAASILGKDAVPPPPWPDRPFALSLVCIALLVVVWTVWALARSCRKQLGSDVSGFFLATARILVIVTAVVAFLDLQPVILFYLIHPNWIDAWSKPLSALVAPGTILATAVSFLSGRIATFLRSTETHGGKGVLVARIGARALILVVSLFVPLLLYAAFLWLTLSLMDAPAGAWKALGIAVVLGAISWPFSPNANSLHRFYRDRLSKAFLFTQVSKAATPPPRPAILASVTRKGMRVLRRENEDSSAEPQVILTSNQDTGTATTDTELSARAAAGEVWGKEKARVSTETRDKWKMIRRDPIPLGELADSKTPFHIVNTTLNLQGSIHANKRGRDCDFFVFTPRCFGGELVNYYPTAATRAELNETSQEDGRAVDLATALAISGAAASSAMGSQKIFRSLAPTLALLNIRLGYWLDNPLPRDGERGALWRSIKKQLYLLVEMFGFLDERSDRLYLTDGGHIENLGVYELLRRGCQVIVAVDGEADRDISCGSLLAVERYARIDFGIRIDIDPSGIAAAHNAVTRTLDENQPIKPVYGPHAALGRITYPNGVTGYLLYIKAAVTGDEPDYVIRYKRNNPAFPHESTGDQFFSEEQFECYRALGFHAVDRLLRKVEPVAMPASGPGEAAVGREENEALVAGFWAALVHADPPSNLR